MNRSNKYLEDTRQIADSLLFLQNAKAEKERLILQLNEYLQQMRNNQNVFSIFPALVSEIQSGLTIQHFNAQTAGDKIDELKKLLLKLSYMHEMVSEMEQIKNPVLEVKVALQDHKTRFGNSASKLLFRSVDTLYFEMHRFEELFKKAFAQLNDDKQKRDRVRSLMVQDLPVISQFPAIEAELRKITEGEAKGSIGPDHVIANYPSIRDSLNKLNEFNKYFSQLSKDYLAILSAYDLQIFQNVKAAVSLGSLSGEFMRINSRATEYKNKMIKLDTLRNQVFTLRKEINEKIGDLSPNHQTYIRDEINKVQELLIDRPDSGFEKAEAKIITIRELLKKEFRSNDQRATDTLYIRQSIVRYENNIWQEDLTTLFEELNNFVNGRSVWTKDEFGNASQRFITQKNEALESTKAHFDLYFTKNREYKNRFEKIANTKSSKKELEQLLNEMSSFKPLKDIFYKFLK